MQAVQQHPDLRGTHIDFKLSTSHGAANQDCTRDAGFDTLVVRQVAELITLGPRAQHCARVHNGGQHVSPCQFHDLLSSADSGTVLLDARNAYESDIGRFEKVRGGVVVCILVCNLVRANPALCRRSLQTESRRHMPGAFHPASLHLLALYLAASAWYHALCAQYRITSCLRSAPDHFLQDGIETFKPGTRCFSELPGWLDSEAGSLSGKQVLMYCTGGVRCERASAYLREKGAAFDSVFQLRGAQLQLEFCMWFASILRKLMNRLSCCRASLNVCGPKTTRTNLTRVDVSQNGWVVNTGHKGACRRHSALFGGLSRWRLLSRQELCV